MSKKRLQFAAQFQNGKWNIELNTPTFAWEEEGIHYCYSPSFDILGYGKSLAEAKNSFKTMMEEYLQYTTNKNTLWEELSQLGWYVNKRKKKVLPPDDDLLLENETYQDILGREHTVDSFNKHLVLD